MFKRNATDQLLKLLLLRRDHFLKCFFERLESFSEQGHHRDKAVILSTLVEARRLKPLVDIFLATDFAKKEEQPIIVKVVSWLEVKSGGCVL